MTDTSHIKALDGVRGIALLIVVFAHTTPQVFPGGNIGVDLFFVLSGFLITSILLSEHVRSGRISIWRFYFRRALRLFPALALVVLAIIAYSAVFEPELLPSTFDNAKWVAGYAWNWVLAVNIDGRPAWTFQTMFSHLWSLSVEEQFYILWPFVLIAALSAKAPKWTIGAILVVGMMLPAVSRLLIWDHGARLDLYFRTDLRFDNLMWGAAAAWLATYRGEMFEAPAVRRALAVSGVVGLVAMLGLARHDLLSNGFLYLGGYSLIGVLAATLILAAALDAWRPLTKLLEFRPLTFTGEISYGLYLWHVPVFTVLHGLSIGDLGRNTLAIVGSYAVASLSYYLMEKPIRAKGREWLARHRRAAAISAAPAH